MAAPKSTKSDLIAKFLDTLKATFPRTPELNRLELVESVLFAILRENRSSTEALATLARFKTEFDDDYNELRVSSLREIQKCIGPCPDSENRAKAIRKFLHQFFDKNYKFQIEGFTKRPFKEVREELKNYDILADDHHLAYLQVQCRGDHAFPVDARIAETGKRLGLIDKSSDVAVLRGILEKNITKAQIHLAIALVERFVNEICTAAAPRCTECPFREQCPYYRELTNPKEVKEPKGVGKKPMPIGSAPDSKTRHSESKPKETSKPKSSSPKSAVVAEPPKAEPSSSTKTPKATLKSSAKVISEPAPAQTKSTTKSKASAHQEAPAADSNVPVIPQKIKPESSKSDAKPTGAKKSKKK
jgi:endonuclease III